MTTDTHIQIKYDELNDDTCTNIQIKYNELDSWNNDIGRAEFGLSILKVHSGEVLPAEKDLLGGVRAQTVPIVRNNI